MLDRSLNHYLVKANRITGWALLALVLVFVPTGFAITGRYGFSTLVEPNLARDIHWTLVWPLIGVFVVHSILNVYFSFKRWGWLSWPPGQTT